MNTQLLIGDHYSQLALLNTLKLQGVDLTDFKALQSILSNDKQYEYLFKRNCSVSVKIGLTLKLKAEIDSLLTKKNKEKNTSLNDINMMLCIILNQNAKIEQDLNFVKSIKSEVNDLHKQFIVPKNVVVTAKQKRKIAVAQALAKL